MRERRWVDPVFALVLFLLVVSTVVASLIVRAEVDDRLLGSARVAATAVRQDVQLNLRRDVAAAAGLAGSLPDVAAVDAATWTAAVERIAAAGAFTDVSAVNLLVVAGTDDVDEVLAGLPASVTDRLEVRLTDGPVHGVVTNVWPEAANAVVLGYDVVDNDDASRAAIAAMSRGTVQVSSPTRVLQEPAQQRSAIVYVPIVPEAGGPATGLINLVFRAERLLDEVIEVIPDGAHVRWVDARTGPTSATRSSRTSAPRSTSARRPSRCSPSTGGSGTSRSRSHGRRRVRSSGRHPGWWPPSVGCSSSAAGDGHHVALDGATCGRTGPPPDRRPGGLLARARHPERRPRGPRPLQGPSARCRLARPAGAARGHQRLGRGAAGPRPHRRAASRPVAASPAAVGAHAGVDRRAARLRAGPCRPAASRSLARGPTSVGRGDGGGSRDRAGAAAVGRDHAAAGRRRPGPRRTRPPQPADQRRHARRTARGGRAGRRRGGGGDPGPGPYGLGLAIASQLAEANGGTLAYAEGAPGSCFTLRLPVHLERDVGATR